MTKYHDLFGKLLYKPIAGSGLDQEETQWIIDLSGASNVTEEDAKLLVRFIANFKTDYKVAAKSFKSLNLIDRIRNLLEYYCPTKPIDFDMIKEAYLMNHPVLILINIDGGITLKSNRELDVER
jgi:glutathionyl-hydroquinone reductase